MRAARRPGPSGLGVVRSIQWLYAYGHRERFSLVVVLCLVGDGFRTVAGSLDSMPFGVEILTESLILAQDERWRRA